LRWLPRGLLLMGGILTAFPEVNTSIIGIAIVLSVHIINCLVVRRASRAAAKVDTGHPISM